MKTIIGISLLISIGILVFGLTGNDNKNEIIKKSMINQKNLTEAYFAGGCFWCMEGVFESQEGVKEAVSGYIGGSKEDAVYEKVSTGETGHREGVKIIYDPEIISYKTLVELYWKQIDPTDKGGQFADRGYHYTTAIYYNNEEEKNISINSKNKLGETGKFDKEIATEILKSTPFYDAEEYHQDYYKKSSLRYKAYEIGSGRKDFKDKTWKEYDFNENKIKLNKEELKKKLTPLQYKVTQEEGTERPFDNEYWDNKKEGIYVDLIDGTPLYSSIDKFVSGTGWPSFTQPIDARFISEHEDNTLFFNRTEVRSKTSDSHLGHVFRDGPKDKGGLRYCMNSASMKFIEKNELENEGYGEYLKLFN